MMLPTKDEKSCLLFSTKVLSSNKKKMDHCSGVFGSGYTGKLVFTDLSAKPYYYSIITESNKAWSDSLVLDGLLKNEKYESDIYHYLCNCSSVKHVSFIYHNKYNVASTAHQCDLGYEYYDKIEEPDCNFPSHFGDGKIQFVCAMDFETTETTEIPETSSTTIATTESLLQQALQQKLLLQGLAKNETVTEANTIKAEKEIRSPWSLDS